MIHEILNGMNPDVELVLLHYSIIQRYCNLYSALNLVHLELAAIGN